MKPALVNITLDDPKAERVRRSHVAAIQEIQAAPAASLVIFPKVSLANGVTVPVSHGLGRAPLWVGISVLRGASAVSGGWIVDTLAGDRTKQILLQANGYGATVIVDVAIL